MAAQIGRQNMPVAAQRRRDPIPVAAMVAPAMHEQQRRRGRVTPIDIVQSQPLREVDPRGRSGAVEIVAMIYLPLRSRPCAANLAQGRLASRPKHRSGGGQAKPPRAVAEAGHQAGVLFAKYNLRARRLGPSCSLDFSLGRRCQGSRQLETFGWSHARYTPSCRVDDALNLTPCAVQFKGQDGHWRKRRWRSCIRSARD